MRVAALSSSRVLSGLHARTSARSCSDPSGGSLARSLFLVGMGGLAWVW